MLPRTVLEIILSMNDKDASSATSPAAVRGQVV